MPQQPRRSTHLLTSAILLLALSIVPVASAQEAAEPSPPVLGFWLGGGVMVNQPRVSEQLARGWEDVGELGRGTGVQLSAGYDASRFGLGLELESTNTHVGDRPGRNLALAAVFRVPSPWQPSRSWPASIAAGYVRYGLGGAYVLPSEIPSDYLHNVPSPLAGGERLMLLGNGARLGIEAKHATSTRTAITVGVKADVVQFGSATYQYGDQTLTNPGWGIIPQVAVAFVVHRGFHR